MKGVEEVVGESCVCACAECCARGEPTGGE